MASLLQPHGESASALLQRQIPSLLTHSSTHSASNNGIKVTSSFIKPWTTFKTDLRPYLQRLSHTLRDVQVARMDVPEILLTGGKVTVQGRFLQHVGLVAVSLCMKEIPALRSWSFSDIHQSCL